MPDAPKKRSVLIAGHPTSVSLEGAFWQALREAAAAQGRSVNDLASEIDAGRGEASLSGAIRLYLLDHYRRCGR